MGLEAVGRLGDRIEFWKLEGRQGTGLLESLISMPVKMSPQGKLRQTCLP